MGGRSRSDNRTSTTQQSTSTVLDGTYAGASGVNHDESRTEIDNSVSDSNNQEFALDYELDSSVNDSHNTEIRDSGNTTNSTDIRDSGNTTHSTDINDVGNTDIRDSGNTTHNTDISDVGNTHTDIRDSGNVTRNTDINNEIDNSVNDSYNTNTEINQEYNIDNSVTQDIDNSQNYDIDYEIDNSVHNDGEFAGNSGTIIFTDNGAVQAATELGAQALLSNEAITGQAFDFAEQALGAVNDNVNSAFDFAGNAASEFAGALAGVTLDNSELLTNTVNGAVDAISGTAQFAIDENSRFALDSLTSIERANADALAAVTDNTALAFDYAEGVAEGFAGTLAGVTMDNAALLNNTVNSAISSVTEFGNDAISGLESAHSNSLSVINENTAQSLGFAAGIVNELSNNQQHSLELLGAQSAAAIGEVRNANGEALSFIADNQELTQQNNLALAENFASELSSITNANIANTQQAIGAIREQSDNSLAQVAELTRNLSLEGNDIVAESATSMTKYIAIALGLLGVSFIIGGRFA